MPSWPTCQAPSTASSSVTWPEATAAAAALVEPTAATALVCVCATVPTVVTHRRAIGILRERLAVEGIVDVFDRAPVAPRLSRFTSRGLPEPIKMTTTAISSGRKIMSSQKGMM